MLRVLLSPQAENDLELIFNYTSDNWSVEQAIKYQNELNEGFLRLSVYPELGALYPYIRGNYRKLHINSHLAFYQSTSTEIVIIRILHESMDLKNTL